MSEDNSRRPIEISFPIDQVNEIAEKEAHAKRYYRPVYTMHKWWARRLGSVFRTMILYALANEEMTVDGERQSTFSEDNGLPEIDWENPEALWEYYLEDVDFEGKTVLDPFMGGGTSIVESIRMGCNAIGSELNPVAWFVVKKEVEPVNLNKLDAAFEEVRENVGEEVQDYYRTECPHCEDEEHHADVMHTFWVNELPCRNCGEDIPLFKDYRLANSRSSNDSHYNVFCPECWKIFPTEDARSTTTCPDSECDTEFVPYDAGHAARGSYTCPHCDEHPKMDIIESVERFGKADRVPYAIEYYCQKLMKEATKSHSSLIIS